jgi:O-antigen/teichoic acid export membrane protein
MTQPVSKARLLVTGSALRTIALAVNIVSTFILMPFLVHALGMRWYGMWSLINSVVGYYILLDFGLSIAAQRFMTLALANRDEEGANRIFSTALALSGAVALLITLTAIGVAAASAQGLFFDDPAEGQTFALVILLMGIAFALGLPFNVVTGAISARLRYDLLSHVEIAVAILRVVLVLYFLNQSASILMLALVTVGLRQFRSLALLVLLRRVCPFLKPRPRQISRAAAREITNFGFYAFIGNISGMVQTRLDTILISVFLGLKWVTFYDVALRMFEYFGMLLGRAFGIMLPIFTERHAQNDHDGLREAMFLIQRLSTAASVFLGGGILVCGKDFIMLWMGPEFATSYLPMAILIVGAMIRFMQASLGDFLVATGRYRFSAAMTVFETAINLGLSLLLVQYFGILGVALGTTIATTFSTAVIMPFYVSRQLGISAWAYRWNQLAIALPVGLLQVPAWLLFQEMRIGSFLELLAVAVPYYAVLAFVIYRLILPRQDRTTLMRSLPALPWKTA